MFNCGSNEASKIFLGKNIKNGSLLSKLQSKLKRCNSL